MTTPGAIAEQPAAPPNAGAGRLRDLGARSDGAAATGDGQAGFDDVLKTLQRDDAEPARESSDSPKTSTRTGPPQNANTPGRASDDPSATLQPPAPTKYVGYGNLDLGDEQTQSAGEEALPDDAQGSPPEGDASGVRDIAAIVGLVVLDPSVGSAGATPSQIGTTDATHPAAQTKVVVDQIAAAGEGEPAVAKDAAHDLGAARSPTAEEEVAIARLSDALGSTEADKISRSDKGRKVTIETSASSASEDDTSALPADGGATSQPLKARVITQETHFAPVMRSSPELQTGDFAAEKGKPELGTEATGSQSAPSVAKVLPSGDGALAFAASPVSQIADHVIAAAPTADPAVQAGAVPEMAAMKPAIKVLSIQLQPADLGTITVRMELKDSELKLHVEADRADTADLIRGDQDTLSRLLRSAGFAIDPSAIRVVEGDRVAASQQLGQQGTQTNLQSSPQWQSGSSERQGHGQRGSTGDGDKSPKSSRNDSNETTTNRGGRGLVV